MSQASLVAHPTITGSGNLGEMSDIDTARTVRQIIVSSGLTQKVFAQRLGTSASRLSTYATGRTTPSADILLRMYRIAREATTDGRGWPTAAQTAAQMNGALERGQDDWAYRLMLEGRDRLLRLDPEQRASWAETEPGITDVRWLTLFQAVVKRAWREEWGPAPAWADPRPLGRRWTPLVPLHQRDPERPFADLGIDITTRDLATA